MLDAIARYLCADGDAASALICDVFEIDADEVLRDGVNALIRRDYELAMRRSKKDRFKGLRYMPPDLKEYIKVQKGEAFENKQTPSVDVALLTHEEKWAWSRLSGSQQRYFDSHVDYQAWVRGGCKNSAFPGAIRTATREQ